MSTTEGSGRFINDGLVFYVDFANRKSFVPNLLNYSSWTVGTGSISTNPLLYGASGYVQNGDTIENVRVLGVDPFGNTQSIIWKGYSQDGTFDSGGGDGGFLTSRFNIDPTKIYRYSVWTKRDGMTVGLTTSGSFYLGMNAYGSDGGLHTLSNKNTGTNSNVYFHYTTNSGLSTTASVSPPFLGGLNVWTLVVGHIWPAGTPTASLNIGSDVNGLPLNYNHQDSGIWSRSGGKIGNLVVGDWIWNATSSQSLHRAFNFYSSDTTATQSFVYPRVDLIDGTEPTIQQLLTGAEPVGNLMYDEGIYVNNSSSFYTNALSFDSNAKNAISGTISSTFSVYSASVWINLNSEVNSSSPGMPIFQLGSPGVEPFTLYTGNSTANLTNETIVLTSSSSKRTGVVGLTVYGGVWHNIIINWENSKYGIYLDGISLTTTSGTSTDVALKTSVGYVIIGGNSNDIGNGYFNGKISSFSVWQKTLSSDEIIRIYTKGKSKLGI